MEHTWIGGLTIAVGVLWTMHVATHRTVVRKLDECEKERGLLWRAMWKHSPVTNSKPCPKSVEETRAKLVDSKEIDAD